MKMNWYCLIASACAHMAIFSPTPRGDDELDSLTGPCGKGLDSPTAGVRTAVDVKDLVVKIEVADKDADVVINAGVGADPKSFPLVLKQVKASLEDIDIPVDLKLVPGLKNGDLVTLQVIETAADGIKYGCIDLTVNGIPVATTTTEVKTVVKTTETVTTTEVETTETVATTSVTKASVTESKATTVATSTATVTESSTTGPATTSPAEPILSSASTLSASGLVLAFAALF